MNGTLTSEPVPLLRNLSEPGARFRAAAPNHPEALLEEPQAFQAVGEKNGVFGSYKTCFFRVKTVATQKRKEPILMNKFC